MYTSTYAENNRAANTVRTQHQQKQDKDYESQHKEQQPHHIERRATVRDRLVQILRQYNNKMELHLESKTNQN